MLRHLRRVLLPLLAAIALLVAVPSTALEPVTLDDMIALVEAGVGQDVIELQVVRTGSTFDLGVDEILRLRKAGADDALIAFLLEQTPAPAFTEGSAPRSVISASEKAESGAASRMDEVVGDAAAQPAAGASAAPGLAFPASVEITVRHEGEGTEGRMAELEERIDDLEGGGERAVGEGWYPRHPINDDTEYPVFTYPGLWGYGYGYPAIQPVPFRTIPSGPFLSFTGAAHAGFDPFRPVGPCVPGQACSVAQRVAHPYPPAK